MRLSDEVLGRRFAAEHGEACEQWSSDDFVEYFWSVMDDEGEVVRSAWWNGGSAAAIRRYQGVFTGSDDAETYGPFDSFEEAVRDGPNFSDTYDRIMDDWIHPDFL